MASANSDENKKVALITGITGQDGSYLAEFLLAKGYEVNMIENLSERKERNPCNFVPGSWNRSAQLQLQHGPHTAPL